MAVHPANIDFTLEPRTVVDARGILQMASISPSDLLSTFPHLGLAIRLICLGSIRFQCSLAGLAQQGVMVGDLEEEKEWSHALFPLAPSPCGHLHLQD